MPTTQSKAKKPTTTVAKRSYEQFDEPLTPELIKARDALEHPPPRGAFDPRGEWTQTWRIWLLSHPWDHYRGFIEIERAPADGGEVVLTVNQTTTQARQYAVHETLADMRCANDALATPRSWRLLSRLVDVRTDKDYASAAIDETGRMEKGRILLKIGGQTFTREAPAVATSNWSLFDAVQRLPGEGVALAPFAMLDCLDQIKERQRLTYGGEATIPFGDETVAVRRYHQIGAGIQPTVYYVDEQGRLLLSLSGLRAVILDPNVKEAHAKTMAWLAKKGQQS
jgi:hypothetical protein